MENNRSQDELEIDFKELLSTYRAQWKWFVLAVVVSLLFAFLYLRYTAPQYKASVTILVKDEKKAGMLSELSAFTDMGLAGGIKSNVDNEIEILKSRTVVESTVKKLNLQTHVFVKDSGRELELFDKSPIEAVFVAKTAKFHESKISFKFTNLAATAFELENVSEDESIKKIIYPAQKFKYGEYIKTAYGILVIRKTPFYDAFFSKETNVLGIVINPLDAEVEGFRARLDVTPLKKTGSIVAISIIDPTFRKAEMFLDKLVETYNEDAASDKNVISQNTSEFIASRLLLINQELDGVEQDAENFKRSNNLTDIRSDAQIFIEGTSEYNKKSVETEIQLNVIASLLDFMQKSSNSDLLPANLISGEGDAAGLIASYNKLILDRNRLLKSATAANPFVEKMELEIVSLKANVGESLKRMQSSLNIQKRNLKNQENVLGGKIGKIPTQERQFRVIARQQKVKEELYLFLLQKREEAAITLAATEPNVRVIDAAKADMNPVSPKKSLIYMAALFAGLLVPCGVLFLLVMTDTKIKSRLDLEGKSQIPFIGDVPSSDSPTEVIQLASRSSSAEAMRIIRTNVEFMMSWVEEAKAKTIFLTSTFPKEGKTFVSANLAATFALSGKKVLLIGMDIRNPRLDEYFTLPNKGFTNYLSSKDLKIEDLIIKQPGFEDFYILPAGLIPPNPAELLMNKKVEILFKELKAQYDYIFVDTAPVSLVTDTLLIAKHADCFIYVARANFLEKRMLDIPNALYKEQKLPNMCLLLNDTDSTKGYGYGYGYGGNVTKATWYEKIWKR